jgi:RNA polymerase sigma-70 factor (ECF subfamily)
MMVQAMNIVDAQVQEMEPVGNRDLDLVMRHRYGDASAFDEVYRRFSPMVYNLALRMCGNPDDAADLSQEAFLRVYRHLGKFRGHSALKSWIYRVTLNHCRSRLGRRRLPSQPIEREDERAVEDPRRGPEERALAHDAERRVAAALTRVKPSFREAVVLRDLEGLSYAEIAEVLRVRIGTVRSRISRGREQLKEFLETPS